MRSTKFGYEILSFRFTRSISKMIAMKMIKIHSYVSFLLVCSIYHEFLSIRCKKWSQQITVSQEWRK